MDGWLKGVCKETHHEVNESPDHGALHHRPEVHPQAGEIHEPVDGDDGLEGGEPGPDAVEDEPDDSELDGDEGSRAGPRVGRAGLGGKLAGVRSWMSVHGHACSVRPDAANTYVHMYMWA